MNAWEIYIIGQADSISRGCLIFAFFWFLFWIMRCVTVAIHNDNYSYGEKWGYPKNRFLLFPILLLLFEILIPSSSTLALMYSLPAITQNENFKALPDDIAAFLRKTIRDSIEKETK